MSVIESEISPQCLEIFSNNIKFKKGFSKVRPFSIWNKFTEISTEKKENEYRLSILATEQFKETDLMVANMDLEVLNVIFIDFIKID